MLKVSTRQWAKPVLVVRTLIDQRGDPAHGESVAFNAEARDDAIGAARDVGVMTKCLPLVDIRDVDLYHRTVKTIERIENRDRRMGKRRRIYHDASRGFAGFVDPVDDFIFAVRLMESQLQTKFGGNVATRFLDIGQGLMTVNGRLALAEQIEIGTVQHVHKPFHHCNILTTAAASRKRAASSVTAKLRARGAETSGSFRLRFWAK